MKATILTVLISFVICGPLWATRNQVVPNGAFGSAIANQIGEFGDDVSCKPPNNTMMQLNIRPGCYGANLRGGGGVMVADKTKPLMVHINMKNGDSIEDAFLAFSPAVAYPESAGRICDWKNFPSEAKMEVECKVFIENQLQLVKFSDCTSNGASHVTQKVFTCQKTSLGRELASAQAQIKCSHYLTHRGQNFAGNNAYNVSANLNCGIDDAFDNLNESTSIQFSSMQPQLSTFSTKGLVSVTMSADDKILKLTPNVRMNRLNGEIITEGDQPLIRYKVYQWNGEQDFDKQYLSEAGIKDNKWRLLASKGQPAQVAKNEKCYGITFAALGGNAFCGSFYSPLMLFFSKDNRPQFRGMSQFPIRQGVNMVYWPEKGSNGFFLALDSFSDKSIRDGSQLFGNSNQHDNGFEKLAKYDLNKDGIINSKDKVYNKLVLWRDKNGNGVSDKGEVFSLKKMQVRAIGLNYNNQNRKQFGRRAEAREFGQFEYIVKNGEKEISKKGDIIDIWLHPHELNNVISEIKTGKRKLSNK